MSCPVRLQSVHEICNTNLLNHTTWVCRDQPCDACEQVLWDLRADDPLEYSCVVEALMAAWVRGDLPSPAPQATVPYAHQAGPHCQCSLLEAFTLRGPMLCPQISWPNLTHLLWLW